MSISIFVSIPISMSIYLYLYLYLHLYPYLSLSIISFSIISISTSISISIISISISGCNRSLGNTLNITSYRRLASRNLIFVIHLVSNYILYFQPWVQPWWFPSPSSSSSSVSSVFNSLWGERMTGGWYTEEERPWRRGGQQALGRPRDYEGGYR